MSSWAEVLARQARLALFLDVVDSMEAVVFAGGLRTDNIISLFVLPVSRLYAEVTDGLMGGYSCEDSVSRSSMSLF